MDEDMQPLPHEDSPSIPSLLNARTRPTVLLFVWNIPHYRAPIYRRLSRNPYLQFTVCAGAETHLFDGGFLATAGETRALEGIRWRPLRSVRVRRGPFKGYEWQPEAFRIVRREDIDAVISFGIKSFSNYLIRMVCGIRGIPLLEWSQGLKRPERGLKWSLRKLYMKQADAWLLYGSFARDFFVAHGFDEKRVFVVRNSLDHEAQVRLREQLTPDDLRRTRESLDVRDAGQRLIIHSGRLEPRKNLHILIDALALLGERGREVTAVLIGDGPEESRLRRRGEERGVSDRIIFRGACYEEAELARLFSASDLCVAPGAVGLLAMHSLVYGTPILTCENTEWAHGPEVETIVEGATGGYFRAGDVADLAARVESMLFPQPCKPGMAEACRQIIDTYYTPRHQERVVIETLNTVLPPDRRIPLPDS